MISTANLVSISDVPDSLSKSGSGRILPFLSGIRIRPDLDMKKKSGSGSGTSLLRIHNLMPNTQLHNIHTIRVKVIFLQKVTMYLEKNTLLFYQA